MQDSISKTEEGSYHVSSFSANTQVEIRRLDAQVDLFWPHAEHTYPLDSHRCRLIEEIKAWAAE